MHSDEDKLMVVICPQYIVEIANAHVDPTCHDDEISPCTHSYIAGMHVHVLRKTAANIPNVDFPMSSLRMESVAAINYIQFEHKIIHR